ncbi:MAG: PD-(D/E)XK nuclease family protein [Hespellia sp.]|nr:PD-(D/E)XK nuclease family protein [Hespellia sp.]
MSLQFIFGNSGSGKSYHLYQNIIESSMKNPDKNYLVIVPEQFTMQTQKDLVTMHPNHGIMNIDVLSFGRLAHRIFEEVGGSSRTILDDEGKNLILRKIAGDYEDDLRVLKGNLKKQGYISEVKSVISEFVQYDIGVEQVDEILSELNPDQYLSYKLQDIRVVYEGFMKYLQDKYITKEELLDVLCEVAEQSGILKGSVIALDGFTGFTPVQNKLIQRLLGICDQILVTVTIDGAEDPFVYQHPYQMFALSKQMVTSLVRVAQEAHTIIEEPVRLFDKPVYRFRTNEALAFLESELFRYSNRKYDRKQNAVEIHCAASPKEEAQFVAGEIRKLVRTKGYRYREIAVITGDLNIYANHLEKICERYDIPVFMDHKKSVLLNSFVEYVRSLLAMAEQGYTYESVFRFLRTGLTPFDRAEMDELENYVIATGIRGYKKWQTVWVRRTKRMSEEDLGKLNGIRVRFVEMIDELAFVLKQRKKTVRDVTGAVYEFLVKEQMQEKVSRMEERFQKEGELALAKEYSQVYRIVIDLFDKFVSLLGNEYISLAEYCELLDAGLEEAKVGVIPPSLDQVVIGDIERTRLKDIKALFLIGANDTLIPGQLGKGGLLSERDREHLLEEGVSLTPGPKEKAYIQKFYLYLSMTKPTEHLYLSYSRLGSDEKAVRPAYLVGEVRKLFPGISVVDEAAVTFAERESTPDGGMEYLTRGLLERQKGIGEEWKELYRWYHSHPQLRGRVEEMVKTAFCQKERENLTEKTAMELYGEMPKVSVTRLEKFISCAYAHFLSYGLHLQEREVYEFQNVDLGIIAHSAIEKYSKKLQMQQLEWTEVGEELKKELVESSVSESVADYGNTVLYSNARNEYMITRIKRLMNRTVWALTRQLECGDFRPSEQEYNFGAGKIDRIDICEEDDKVYVKVIDYKTGVKAFDLSELYYGLQMQLAVYMKQAMEMEAKKHPGKNIIPSGIFYYRIKDPIVEKASDVAAIEREILSALQLDGLVNADRQNIEHLDKNLQGKSLVIPVSVKKDQNLGSASKVVSEENFERIFAYAGKVLDQAKAKMLSGAADPVPSVYNGQSSCEYCSFKNICGFDTRLGYEQNELEPLSDEEALYKMKQTVSPKKTDETNGEEA